MPDAQEKRIAFISDHASPLANLGGVDSGGQNVYVDKLARRLASFGYKIDIFTRRNESELPKIASYYPNVRIIHIKAGQEKPVAKEKMLPFMEEFSQNVIRFIKTQEIGYRLIHANFFMSAMVALKLKKELGIPFVITFHALGKRRRFHQGENDKFPNKRFAIEDEAVKEANQIIAECPQDVEDLTEHYNAPKNKMTIIPCGFDKSEFYPMDKALARRILGLSMDENIILQLGRMVPRKGVENVIKGVADLVKEKDLPVRLLVVGGESEKPDTNLTPEIGRLRQAALREGVADIVEFVGRRDRADLKYYYNAADVFVSTPWYEPFGITPLESMACGVPVIGSNVGGIKYSVVDGETGFLVPPKDPKSLSEKLFTVLSNPGLKKRLKKGAVKRVNSVFTWETVARQVMILYERIMNGFSLSSAAKRDVEVIDKNFNHLIHTIDKTQKTMGAAIIEAAKIISGALSENKKIITCGNGGSASEAQHFAAELVGEFRSGNRRSLPALALNSDSSVITSIGNDYGYEKTFSRQVEGLANPGDVLISISTSGQSTNIIEAFKAAKKKGVVCVGILGKGGGKAAELCDVALVVPSNNTQTIQEVHTSLVHTICELMEKNLFFEENMEIYSYKTVKQKTDKSSQNYNNDEKKQEELDEDKEKYIQIIKQR